MTQGSNNLHFFYGADGSPAIVEFNGVSYGYVKNLQGDIIAIVNASGAAVVQYAYDAWGKPISKTGSMASTLGTLNPFRYRGYVYDEETRLYYLRSRYYNPVWGRFISPDTLIGKKGTTFSHNIYAYCYNQPIRNVDHDGYEGEEYLPKQFYYEFDGEKYLFETHYVQPQEYNYRWLSKAIDIGISIFCLGKAVSAYRLAKEVLKHQTKKKIIKDVLNSCKSAIITGGAEVVADVFDISIGSICVSGLDWLLGENAEDGVYTQDGYWETVPLEIVPGPKPRQIYTPAPESTIPVYTPAPNF